jgi:hypothetical protein
MGIIAVLLYGIMVTLSMLYPDISSMWVGAVLLVNLGTVIAAVVCLLVGFLVMPSLASDEVSKSHTDYHALAQVCYGKCRNFQTCRHGSSGIPAKE